MQRKRSTSPGKTRRSCARLHRPQSASSSGVLPGKSSRHQRGRRVAPAMAMVPLTSPHASYLGAQRHSHREHFLYRKYFREERTSGAEQRETTRRSLAMILIYGSPWNGIYLMHNILNVSELKMQTLSVASRIVVPLSYSDIQGQFVRNQLIQFELLLITTSFVVTIFGVVVSLFGVYFKTDAFSIQNAFQCVVIFTGLIGAFFFYYSV